MFNKVHSSKEEGGIALAFVKSTNIQTYPCGRRRALKEKDLYIPFDPEARLNTENNNRTQSSLNGYTQTYVQSWTEHDVSLVLENYLFTIKYAKEYSDAITASADFGKIIINKLRSLNDTIKNEVESAEKIYANILIEEVPLYSSNTANINLDDYTTEILRNQSDTEMPSTSLDILVDGEDANLPGSYYFSGLSFSTKPLTGDTYLTRSKLSLERGGSLLPQKIVSLCILTRQYDTENEVYTPWQSYEPAYLPFIEHGDTPNSVKVHKLEANQIETDTLNAGAVFIPSDSGGTQTLSAIKLKSMGGPSHEKYYKMFISQATIE